MARVFYEQADGSPLDIDPFRAIVAPRPIGWISTVDEAGVPNLAPYSFFNALSSRPNLVGFSSDGLKDSARNARDQREFVVNFVSAELARQMNESSLELDADVDEFDYCGLRMGRSRLVAPPHVADSPAVLECRLTQFIRLERLGDEPLEKYLVVGEVVAVHIDDAFLTDGRFDTSRARPVVRGGYRDFAVVDRLFEIPRPEPKPAADRPAGKS